MTWMQTQIIGNLGGDPELKYLPDGKAVCNFSVAVTQRKSNENQTVWVRVNAWDKLAELANTYLRKGKKVLVTGVLGFDPATGGPRTFNRQDGTMGASFELTARDLVFLSPKDDGGEDAGGGIDFASRTNAGQAQARPIPTQARPSMEDEDIPF